jgi:hypothetical protein
MQLSRAIKLETFVRLQREKTVWLGARIYAKAASVALFEVKQDRGDSGQVVDLFGESDAAFCAYADAAAASFTVLLY